MSGSFVAAYAGRCKHPDCGRWFAQGELVAYRRLDPRDETQAIMHDDCAQQWDDAKNGLHGLKADDIRLRRGETVCGDCHLVHRGECA
ncbi:hypothetical protein [Gordonia sp. ABSL49_1]|uniref:hypothetical protein n=1 Tax=Gordonia sp. ABSL49_1 TaxID=2920941 RepID=UPI001F0D0AD3|nr:hypothetical protein [Gordonia sp. ABSL49_1]MCH5645125.1 hypothetical protein [Gordonia sp. ABSL49_1]